MFGTLLDQKNIAFSIGWLYFGAGSENSPLPSIKVAKGCSIYTRTGSAYWYARITLKDHKQIKRSLETEDMEEAKVLAMVEKRYCQKLLDKGQSLSRKTFAVVAEEYIKKLEAEVRRGEKKPYQAKDYVRMIRTYFCEHLGKKLISSISNSDIDKYWDTRRDYWVTGKGSGDPYVTSKHVSNGRSYEIKRLSIAE